METPEEQFQINRYMTLEKLMASPIYNPGLYISQEKHQKELRTTLEGVLKEIRPDLVEIEPYDDPVEKSFSQGYKKALEMMVHEIDKVLSELEKEGKDE